MILTTLFTQFYEQTFYQLMFACLFGIKTLHPAANFSYRSESGPFLAMTSLSLLSPPTGTRSLPVANWRSFLFWSSVISCTTSQKYLQGGGYTKVRLNAGRSSFMLIYHNNKIFEILKWQQESLRFKATCLFNQRNNNHCNIREERNSYTG